MNKLTLSVEDVVVKRAKRYAARRGTSVRGSLSSIWISCPGPRRAKKKS